MRIFKQLRQTRFQWHYILGEIILLFVGVTLAIGFNNWNTTVKVAQEREEALQRIQQELQENLQQLVQARADNQAVIAALNDYYGEPTGPEPTIHQLRALQKKHPVVEALQRKDMHELTNIVNFSQQFDQTLEGHYQNALATIEACQ